MPSTNRMAPHSATTLFWSPLSLRSRISATSAIGVGMVMLRMLLYRDEKIVGCDALGRQSLLVNVAAERIPRRPVGLQAIGPEIIAEDAARLLDVVDQERERN